MAALIAVIFASPAILAHPLVANTWGAVVSLFSGESSDVSTSQTERNEQADQLLRAWSQSPIWGHGLGAVIPGYSRSDTQPWQFELQYHVLLMQTGVIGVLLVLTIAVFVVAAIRRAASLRPDMLPTLTVTLCAGIAMLIANASNPYLQAPAHLWAIFLPLAVINVMLRDPASRDVEKTLLPQPSTLK
jgi:O-antigen ligase